MFTDQPVTPLRLEILVDVVHELGARGSLRRDALFEILQPEGLPDLRRSRSADEETPRNAAEQTFRAARDLGLVVEEGSAIRTAEHLRRRGTKTAHDIVLVALDDRVLSRTDVEPYFAPFYSYLLGLGTRAAVRQDYQDWANAYNAAVHGGATTTNPLNETKVRGLGRWYPYAGLGWYDSGSVFHCDPYDRVRRALPRLFESDRRLEADAFMARLAALCPELDGGRLYQDVNPTYDGRRRECTLGLAQALVGLHEDGILILHCPPDSHGWSLAAAVPPNDGATLRSTRLDAVELGTLH